MPFKTLYAIPVLLGCLLFGATAQSQLRKIYLQPKTIAREKQSNYVDSIRFIPLEVKDGIELGAYSDVWVTERYFLLNDYYNKQLILYTKNGHFVKKIKYNKLGGDFYPSYREYTNQITFFGNNKNYTLTTKDRIQIKLDWANPRNKKYFKKYVINLNDSSFEIKKAVPEEKDILGVYPYYDDYYLHSQITTSPLYKDSLDHEVKLYKDNHLVKAFFPYNHVNEPRFLYTGDNASFYKTAFVDSRIIVRPYCDTIYRLLKDSLFPIYQLVLPLENSLPASFFNQPFKSKIERDNFNRNNGWMLRQLYSFYETPRLIFFSVGYLSNYDSYIYEKRKDVIYKTRNLKADSSQYNLDLLSEFSIPQKGDQYYRPLRVSDVLPFFEKNKEAPIPKELEAFLKTKPPATTPLIVEFKLKN